MWLCRRVGKIWRACDPPSRKNSTKRLFWLVQTCSNLFTPAHTCSHLFKSGRVVWAVKIGHFRLAMRRRRSVLVRICTSGCKSEKKFGVHTCSHLLMWCVHTCSHLFTAQWLPTLFARWQFLVEFSPCKSCYFSILCPMLLKLHNFCSPSQGLYHGVRLV